MSVRTDLAIEHDCTVDEKTKGIKQTEEQSGSIKTTVTQVLDGDGEHLIGRPCGTYVTVEFPDIESLADTGELEAALAGALGKFKKPVGTVLAVGLGNTDITPDAVGPLTADGILATRHIAGKFAESVGLYGLKSVAVATPGVLGKTGIEAVELVKSAADAVKPETVFVIDALAAKSPERLFKTVQLCDTGIRPGSGVKNSRSELSEKTVGVPVIALGVPTVTDAESLAFSLTGKEPETESGMFVTPKEVDLLTEKMSKILSSVLNRYFQPDIDPDIIDSLV